MIIANEPSFEYLGEQGRRSRYRRGDSQVGQRWRDGVKILLQGRVKGYEYLHKNPASDRTEESGIIENMKGKNRLRGGTDRKNEEQLRHRERPEDQRTGVIEIVTGGECGLGRKIGSKEEDAGNTDPGTDPED